MKKNLTKIRLFGFLSKEMGKKEWNLKVRSVNEALRAINILTKNKLNHIIEAHGRMTQRYKLVINGKTHRNDIPDIENKPEDLVASDLTIRKNIKTIDIVPVVEGAGLADFAMVVVGVILIIIGIIMIGASGGTGSPLGVALIMSGIGLLAAGIANLLAKPPEPPSIETSAESYLFSGPANTVGEGRAVPLGYGQLRVGAHRVAASFEVTYTSNDVVDNTIKGLGC